MHPVVMWKSRKLEIKKSLPKFGRRYEVKYEYCQHAIQWCIDYYTSDEGYYDLIPQLSCYQNLCYNPYDLIKEYNDYIESIVMNATETLTVDKIISFLINSLEKDQSSKLELLAKSNRSSFVLSMLSAISEVSYLIKKDNSLSLEFPLLDKSRLSHPQLEYLIDMTTSSPILIQIQSSNLDTDNSFNNTPTLSFPSSLFLLSSQLILPNWSKDILLFDYIHSIEALFSQTWYHRKLFIQSFQLLCCVLEFDAIDFSSFIISIKMTKNKRIFLCTINIQLPLYFPPTSTSNSSSSSSSGSSSTSSISLLVHDLIHSTTYPLTSPPSYSVIFEHTTPSNPLAMDIYAKKILLYITNEIEKIAFSDYS